MSALRALLCLVCVLVCASACGTAAGSFPPAQPASTSLPPGDIFNIRLSKAELRANGASEALVEKIGARAFRFSCDSGAIQDESSRRSWHACARNSGPNQRRGCSGPKG
jgi:hypothetical protein